MGDVPLPGNREGRDEVHTWSDLVRFTHGRRGVSSRIPSLEKTEKSVMGVSLGFYFDMGA